MSDWWASIFWTFSVLSFLGVLGLWWADIKHDREVWPKEWK